ncbi:endoglucanase [Halobacteroides halobius DSM 5150]|uniref:Endoglucanase n=1 Tax=Halobacteroides halobius (strain ATCC 35273 / DSM 5150 / MD-1) TaxID=748449 RepID=L0K4W4_HALHC|nr:glycoside hydrolase family 5 protein [Halobacteroides halobius]AGB40282.1 endoglucanase [Halobacteroides halobius DSM 5150]
MNDSFIQVKGENLVRQGEKIRLRGFGLGTWLNMEHFMTGLPGNDQQKRRIFSEVYGKEKAEKFFDNYLANFITEDDFIFLKELGINVVRLSFSYRHFEDDQQPGEYKREGFEHLDRVLKLCEKYDIYAILDLHAVPGGQNPDFHADNNLGVSYFWKDNSLRKRVINLWRYIAEYYNDNTNIAGYDLLNEPVFVSDADIFNNFFDQVISAIREVDSNHILFLEGDSWAQDFSKFKLPQDEQIAYSFHFYPHYSLTKDYPASVNKKEIKEDLESLIGNLKERFQRPLWCGETGAIFGNYGIEYSKDLVKTTLDILENKNVAWTLWSYKDAQAMGLVYPQNDTPWMKLVDSSSWDLWDEKKQSKDVFDFLEEKGYVEPLSEKMRFKLDFRLRAMLQEIYIEQKLKNLLNNIDWEEMKCYTESFLWSNCSYYEEIATLVKDYTVR